MNTISRIILVNNNTLLINCSFLRFVLFYFVLFILTFTSPRSIAANASLRERQPLRAMRRASHSNRLHADKTNKSAVAYNGMKKSKKAATTRHRDTASKVFLRSAELQSPRNRHFSL